MTETMTLLLATGNAHKIREMGQLLADANALLRASSEFPGGPEVDEKGATYEENAVLKARAWAQYSGLPALADDSGIEIDAMDGRPGVLSSRYAPTNDERIAGVLRELEGVEMARRGARFVCVVALAWPDGRLETRRGLCEGRIAEAAAGCGGFGYDPIFFVPERGVTMAELSAEEKNAISHRARAVRAITEALAEVLQGGRP